MRTLQYLVILLTGTVAMTAAAATKPKTTKLVVCVTFYNAQEDSFGARTVTGKKAQDKKTVAADLALLPVGTVVSLPGLEKIVGRSTFVVGDTGTAVVKREASKARATKLWKEGKISRLQYTHLAEAPVVDIFVNVSRRELRELASRSPEFVEAKL